MLVKKFGGLAAILRHLGRSLFCTIRCLNFCIQKHGQHGQFYMVGCDTWPSWKISSLYNSLSELLYTEAIDISAPEDVNPTVNTVSDTILELYWNCHFSHPPP